MLGYVLALLLSASKLGLGLPSQDTQLVLAPSPDFAHVHAEEHVVDKTILAALETHSDPVAALLFLRPELAADLAAPRLLHVAGEQKPEWMTEGDKLHLRRRRKKFMDITDHQDFYAQQAEGSWAGKASRSASSRSQGAPCSRCCRPARFEA